MALMIGYTINGYRWDVENKQVITSRDVKFDENCFPIENGRLDNSRSRIVNSSTFEEKSWQIDDVFKSIETALTEYSHLNDGLRR